MQKLKNNLQDIISWITSKTEQLIIWKDKNIKVSKIINIGFSITFIIFLFVYLKDDARLILGILTDIKVKYLMYGCVIYGVNYYIFFEVWCILLDSFNHNISVIHSLKIFSSTYFSKFIPTPVFFYISRIAQMNKFGINTKESFKITLSEFLYQLFSGISILSIINIQIKKPITYFGILGLLPLFFLLIFSQETNIKNTYGKNKENIKKIFRQVVLIIFEFFIWLFGGLFFRFILHSMSLATSSFGFKIIMNIWILSNVTSMIGSYLLGGLGILREFTLVLLLNDYFSSSIALIIAGIVRLSLTIFGVLWASVNYFSILMIMKIKHRIIK